MKRSRPERDDSPISLMWLTDFTVEDTGMAKPPSCFTEPDAQDKLATFPTPCSPLAADAACMVVPHTPCTPVFSSISRSTQHAVAMDPQLAEDINYKTSPHVKPPYSYPDLIRMAIEDSEQQKMTLSAIYKWISDHFCYYRHADPTWQNSIRHSLSRNKGFVKVPREKGEPGRGGFWKLNPQYAKKTKSSDFQNLQKPPVFSVDAELQQLLKNYEEITGDKDCSAAGDKAGQKRRQPSPTRPAKVPRLSSSASLTQEEQTELGLLEGVIDWSAVFDTNLSGDFSTFGDLELLVPVSPATQDLDLMVQGHNIDLPQGQEQKKGQEPVDILSASWQKNVDLEETVMATSFLQQLWEEEPNEDLGNCINIEQLFDLDASLPADASGRSGLTTLP